MTYKITSEMINKRKQEIKYCEAMKDGYACMQRKGHLQKHEAYNEDGQVMKTW